MAESSTRRKKRPRAQEQALVTPPAATEPAITELQAASSSNAAPAWLEGIRLAYEGSDGYSIARTAKRQQREEGIFLDGIQYGEVDPLSFAAALAWCDPKAGERFIDLGSGNGKATLTAAAAFPFASATGVEIMRPLHEAAWRAHQRSRQGDWLQCTEVDFVCADALKHPWTSADVVFVSTTCWTDDMCAQLARDARSLKSGARLVCTSRPLDCTALRLLRRELLPYARGTLTFLAYERV